MRGENAFTVEGVVTEVRSERTCQAKLANGHHVFGFLRARDSGKVELVKGKTVVLKLSPFDLSEGQILVDRNRI
jgi:translation initiation factor IF-1